MKGGAWKAQGGRQTREEEGWGFFRDIHEPFGHHLAQSMNHSHDALKDTHDASKVS